LALFPFHVWAPTVYQGAANQVTTYIATVSKAAAIAVLIRLVALTGGDGQNLVHVLIALSLLSMTLGNLVAIMQKDLKRLLAVLLATAIVVGGIFPDRLYSLALAAARFVL